MQITKPQKKAPNPQLQIHTRQPFDTCERRQLVFQLCLGKGHFSKLMTKWKKKKKKAAHKRALPFGIARLNAKNSLFSQQEMKTNCIYNPPWAEPRFPNVTPPTEGSAAALASMGQVARWGQRQTTTHFTQIFPVTHLPEHEFYCSV